MFLYVKSPTPNRLGVINYWAVDGSVERTAKVAYSAPPVKESPYVKSPTLICENSRVNVEDRIDKLKASHASITLIVLLRQLAVCRITSNCLLTQNMIVNQEYFDEK